MTGNLMDSADCVYFFFDRHNHSLCLFIIRIHTYMVLMNNPLVSGCHIENFKRHSRIFSAVMQSAENFRCLRHAFFICEQLRRHRNRSRNIFCHFCAVASKIQKFRINSYPAGQLGTDLLIIANNQLLRTLSRNTHNILHTVRIGYTIRPVCQSAHAFQFRIFRSSCYLC